MSYTSPGPNEWSAFPELLLSAWDKPAQRQQMARLNEWARRNLVAPDPAEQKADIDLNTTHRQGDGTDHTFIDQDVRTTASPAFVAVNFGSDGDLQSSGSGAFQIAATGVTYSGRNIFSDVDHIFTGDSGSNEMILQSLTDSLQTLFVMGASGASSTKGAQFKLGNAGGQIGNSAYFIFEANDQLDIGDNFDGQLVQIDSAGTITSKGGRVESTTRVTTTYTIVTSDLNIFCDTDSAGFTVTLPSGVDGQRFKVINCGLSGNNLTLAPDGSELLYGANASITITDGNARDIVYNNTEGWY